MNWDLVVGLVFVVVIAGIMVASLWLARPRCPECGSRQIGETLKEPLGMRDVNYHSGGQGGGYTSAQLTYRVKYQCNECQAQWTQTITETR